jgi:hypothetical protein
MTWQHLDRPDLGFANGWTEAINSLESRRIEALPDLREARTLLVTSDYSGGNALNCSAPPRPVNRRSGKWEIDFPVRGL